MPCVPAPSEAAEMPRLPPSSLGDAWAGSRGAAVAWRERAKGAPEGAGHPHLLVSLDPTQPYTHGPLNWATGLFPRAWARGEERTEGKD